MIIKQGNKYIIKSEKGKTLGEFSTLVEAKRRLAEIEMFKHMEKRKKR